MHAVYRAVPLEDVSRILEFCRNHSVQNGGLFEVYPGPEGGMEMVIVNSPDEDGPAGKLSPLGAFYCNFVAPGVISLEEEDPHFDGVPSRKRHVKAIKQIIDILLRDGFPGTRIHFQDPA